MPNPCLPDARLRCGCRRNPRVTDEIRTLARDMLETMYDAPDIGNTAPQIGGSRIVVMDLSKEGETPDPIVMINPEILKYSEETVTTGRVLSIPDLLRVERPGGSRRRIHRSSRGKRVTRDAKERLAVCIQHELVTSMACSASTICRA